MQLSKVNSIGTMAYNKFENGQGDIVKVEISLDDYALLETSNATIPQLENYTWKQSGKTTKFDTETGFLGNGQYGDFGNYYLVKLDGCVEPYFVAKTSITNDVIDDGLVTSMLNSGVSIEIWQ